MCLMSLLWDLLLPGFFQSFQPKNSVTAFPLKLNDAVKAQAYDSLNQCLAVGSSSGQIKMFSVNQYSKHLLPKAALGSNGYLQSQINNSLDVIN